MHKYTRPTLLTLGLGKFLLHGEDAVAYNEESWFHSRKIEEIYLFSKASSTALGTTLTTYLMATKLRFPSG